MIANAAVAIVDNKFRSAQAASPATSGVSGSTIISGLTGVTGSGSGVGSGSGSGSGVTISGSGSGFGVGFTEIKI